MDGSALLLFLWDPWVPVSLPSRAVRGGGGAVITVGAVIVLIVVIAVITEITVTTMTTLPP